MKKEKKNASMIVDMTKGSIVSQILVFALPLFAANALQAIYNIVDMVVVGQVIGGPGMSAVSIGSDVLHILTFVAMGFSSAGQVLIAKYVGAGRIDLIKKLIGTMFTMLFSVAALLSLLCFFFRYQILDLLNTPAEAYAYSESYMVTCAAGLVFIYGYNCVSAILRGMGDSKRPFIFIGIAAVLNIVLDIVFVAVFHMEVFGAALATVLGQSLSFLISMIYLYLNREQFGFDFRAESFRISPEAAGPLLALGIPMAIQSAAVNVSKIILSSWINAEGVVYSALAGIYNKSATMIGVASNSFTTAGSTMISQNIGAKKYERVPRVMRVVLIIGLLVSGSVSLLILMYPDAFCRIFTGDAEVLSVSSVIILPMILNFFGCATRTMAFSLINGSADSRMNLLVALIDGLIGRIGLAALFGFSMHMACRGFWFGDAVAGFAPLLIGTCFYFTGAWKRGE